jgi:hypothetical protein
MLRILFLRSKIRISILKYTCNNLIATNSHGCRPFDESKCRTNVQVATLHAIRGSVSAASTFSIVSHTGVLATRSVYCFSVAVNTANGLKKNSKHYTSDKNHLDRGYIHLTAHISNEFLTRSRFYL